MQKPKIKLFCKTCRAEYRIRGVCNECKYHSIYEQNPNIAQVSPYDSNENYEKWLEKQNVVEFIIDGE